jgi:type I restriction enzyme S subunit
MTEGPPREWETAELGEIGAILSGLTYKPEAVGRSGTLVLRSSNIQGGRLAFDDNVYVTCAIPDRIRVRDDDILICVRNGSRRLIGKSVMLDHGVAGETFGAFMAVYRSDLNPYLRYFFQSDVFTRQVEGHLGATINQITNGSLRKFVVALPGKAERIAITSRLDAAESLISGLEQLIVKRKAVRLGIMRRLLTGEVRLPGFTEDWSQCQLGQMGAFLKGRGIKRDDVRSSGVACIRYGELYTTYRDYTSTTVSFVSPALAKMALPIQRGDLLFAGSGESRDEIGICVAFTGKQRAVAGGDIVVLRAPKANAIYLSCLLNTPGLAAQKARLGQGDAVVHISSRALASIEVVLPSRDEQDAIAQILVDTARQVQQLEARLVKIRAIKRGMMQRLLTGRTRLPLQEPVAA